MDQESFHFDRSTNPKPMIFFILGGPGAGKGTLCDKMAKELGFEHFSTGDLLRKELEENPESSISQTIKANIMEGKLVSSNLLLDLLANNIRNLKYPRPKILLDGFPRNFENIQIWKEKSFDQEFDVKSAIFLECCFETMESNVLERAKTSGRADDNIETIKKRIQIFDDHTKPLLELFEKDEILIVVDAEKSPDDIYLDVIDRLKERKILS